MNIKKGLYIAIGVFLLIILLAVGVTAEFKLSHIINQPYGFIEDFFSRWSLALSAAGTIILALSIFFFIYENRRREEREKQQAIHALHDEVHWNLTHIIKLRFALSERIRHIEKHARLSTALKAPFELIDTRVFDDLRSRGQLHWLGDIRMDIVFCYTLIQDYNTDAGFRLYHLEHLAELFKHYDKAIRDLEAKFKYLPKYMRYKDSESASEQEASKEHSDQASDNSRDELSREYFLSQALVYFLGSALLMQAISASTTVKIFGSEIPWPMFPIWFNTAFGWLLLLFAIFLLYIAYIGRPRSLKQNTIKITAGLVILPLLIFMYNWIQLFIGLIKAQVSVSYVYVFFFGGLIIILLILASPYVLLIKRRRKHSNTSA